MCSKYLNSIMWSINVIGVIAAKKPTDNLLTSFFQSASLLFSFYTCELMWSSKILTKNRAIYWTFARFQNLIIVQQLKWWTGNSSIQVTVNWVMIRNWYEVRYKIKVTKFPYAHLKGTIKLLESPSHFHRHSTV